MKLWSSIDSTNILCCANKQLKGKQHKQYKQTIGALLCYCSPPRRILIYRSFTFQVCGCVCLCDANFDKTRFLFFFLIRSKLAVLSKRARATVWERKQCHHVCTDDRDNNRIRIDILWAALTAYYTCSSTCIWVLFVYMRVCWWMHIYTHARIIDSLKRDSVCMHACESVCVCSVAFLGVSQAFSRLCLGRKK